MITMTALREQVCAETCLYSIFKLPVGARKRQRTPGYLRDERERLVVLFKHCIPCYSSAQVLSDEDKVAQPI